MIDKPHKKLDAWQKSIDLVQKIYELTKSFPKIENYGLTTQMRRAAVSIPANISEGAARQTKKEFVQFLHMAQGSLSELDTLLEISKKLGYLKENNPQELSLLMNDIDKMLTGLIKSLRK
ncbi:MAG: four helix bundle protein [Candidatus Aminicenantia bacterium]